MNKNFIFIVASLLIATNVFCQTSTATFEEIELNPESYYAGDEALDGFSSGSFFFGNSFMYTGGYEIWSGFAVSNYTETEFDPSDLTGQYYSIVGSGYNGSTNFGIVYPYDKMSKVTMPDGGSMQVTGVYVTNGAWPYSAIINGDIIMGDAFKQGDWFKIIAEGENVDGETAIVEFYLADYRSENPEEHYVIDEWTWFDLSELGEVTSITFDLDASRKNNYGLIIPSYFCIDDFNGTNEVGIKNNPKINFTIYPNPIVDEVNISISDLVDNFTIKLYDVCGRQLKSVEVRNPLQNLHKINMNSYKHGIYFIELQIKDNKLIEKIIKQ